MTISASSAYRRDVAGREDSFGRDDGAWIAVATVIQHAALLGGDTQQGLIRDAIELASDVLGDRDLEEAIAAEGLSDDRTASDAIVVLTDRIQEAGALNLASVILDALLVADLSLNAVNRGRIIAKRARIASKLGMIEEAEYRYGEVRRLGRQTKSAELQVQAHIGFATVAQMRGNYPEVRRHSERAARLADRSGLRTLGRQAHLGLLIVAAKNEHFDEALSHGWAAYLAANGKPVAEGEILLNLGQVLLDSGHVMAARAAFVDVVGRELPAHLVLPALGGLAIASALTHAETWTEWCSSEVERLQRSAVPRYSLSSALWECATALKRIGQLERGVSFRTSAYRLAKDHGFHEILFRIESDVVQDDAQRRVKKLAKPAASVAQQIVDMAPKRLPDHVRLAAASVRG